MVEQLITSFIAAAGFGILFNAPKNSLIQCGIVGMLGWVLYFGLAAEGTDAVPATLAGATLVGGLSQVCARFYKTPVIIFNVSGIIPLVPGGLAYDAMRNFVVNDYNLAVQLAAKAFLISGAIAIGLVFSEVVNQIIKKAGSKPTVR
ncbi:threonine/serine exporter family protein [Sediminibacillus massiliensis]|uniref:threonine/serine exporter family protein n=1 Tax=Sediminibacillus massiliensis TaxID=1926277 RepID=UPI000988627C|nr:threonine/serine exporter family protein [Sediminibacillus massiliensis]